MFIKLMVSSDFRVGSVMMNHGMSVGGFQDLPILAVISPKDLKVFSLDGKQSTESG